MLTFLPQLAPMTTVHTILNGNPIMVMVLSQCLLANDKFTVFKALGCVLLATGITLNGKIEEMSLQPVRLTSN